MLKIAFVGNFSVPYSTESHHLWTWRLLGHEVITFQQDKIADDEPIIQALEKQGIQLFQATHSHGWPCFTMRTVEKLQELNIPSFSYHLDKYFGLPSREGTYLQHPSFKLQYFFSTDGGHDDGWKKAGINHIYLPAGCVEYGTYIADNPSGEMFDLRFFGSVGYHTEYPFRPRMAAALKANYGERFEVVTGVREEALNLKMVQTRVVVGDHIFAGCPMYASDRLFETIARGGFLIYPNTPGVTDEIPGLVTYKPQDIDDLIHKIDYYLDKGHESERIERRNLAHEWVKKNATYTVRLKKILEIMGLS